MGPREAPECSLSPLGSLAPQAMGLEGGGEGVVSGLEVNAATLEQALAAASQMFLDTYRQHG
mgnify:CR=1 FL=1